MPRPQLDQLRNALVRSGIAPLHVQRTLREIDEHFEDLVEATLAEGRSRAEAERVAMSRLGDLSAVAEGMRRQPELKSWAWHWPRLAMLVYPLACVAALPAASVVAGIHHRWELGRWLAGLLLAGLVTATMFLALQLSITLA